VKLQELHCRANVRQLGEEELAFYLSHLPLWVVRDGFLRRSFRFPNYAATIRFVNAVAALAEVEDHHPELHVGYGTVEVCWNTHSVQGISENDVICAAKVEGLLGA
jgi:4a-hydroxytetrahydrobiopterin dehydratase